MEEKMCENYTCSFCGAKATACNFFGEQCIQVFTPHKAGCRSFDEEESNYSNHYTGFVNNCTTCMYQGGSSACKLKRIKEIEVI